MPYCKDCTSYTPVNDASGECRINGPTEPDRESERCPSRTFIPRQQAPAKSRRR
jgi:hypothetical protein